MAPTSSNVIVTWSRNSHLYDQDHHTAYTPDSQPKQEFRNLPAMNSHSTIGKLARLIEKYSRIPIHDQALRLYPRNHVHTALPIRTNTQKFITTSQQSQPLESKGSESTESKNSHLDLHPAECGNALVPKSFFDQNSMVYVFNRQVLNQHGERRILSIQLARPILGQHWTIEWCFNAGLNVKDLFDKVICQGMIRCPAGSLQKTLGISEDDATAQVVHFLREAKETKLSFEDLALCSPSGAEQNELGYISRNSTTLVADIVARMSTINSMGIEQVQVREQTDRTFEILWTNDLSQQSKPITIYMRACHTLGDLLKEISNQIQVPAHYLFAKIGMARVRENYHEKDPISTLGTGSHCVHVSIDDRRDLPLISHEDYPNAKLMLDLGRMNRAIEAYLKKMKSTE